MEETHVYIIAEEGTDFIKIGVADRPQSRVSCLQTGNPRQISLHVTYPFPSREQAMQAERKMHEMFERTRAVGEWFCMDVDVAHRALGFIWRDILGHLDVEKPKPRLVASNG